jgi:tetratricopeptide (TPR) repeat protein/membrane protease YdiL (CAAX protease family)
MNVFRVFIVFSIYLLILSTVNAQFNPNSYYEQCLKFEAAGDLEIAQQNCRNALEAKSGFSDAQIALARIELALGRTAEAQSLLRELKSLNNPEVYLLQADVLLREGNTDEATSSVQRAQSSLSESGNVELQGRAAYYSGRVEEVRNNFQTALERYHEAIDIDSLNVEYRLSLAQLLFNLGNLTAAREELESYQTFTSNNRDSRVLDLLAHIKWAQGQLPEAATDLETALNQRNLRDTKSQAQDLQDLALIYWGQGDTKQGGLAMREALKRGASWLSMLGLGLPWLLLLVVVMGIHLWGESRIDSKTSLEAVEHPQLWNVGNVYISLAMSLVVALLSTFAFSLLRYNNLLAIFTPWQANEVRAVFVLVLTLMLAATAVWRVKKNGWDPVERLIGSIDQSPVGVVFGLVLLAAALAYMTYAPRFGMSGGGYFLNLVKLTPLIIAAAILLPLSELYFRAFVMPPLEKRYDKTLAFFIAAGLSALAFASPLFLLVVFGLLMSEVFRRTNSGVNPLIAQLVLNFGLVIGVQFIPWVRGLFL